ncbi:hypothetical protein Ab1vBOLIVR4_gp66 [Agrobacterium phage OLIVR4]|nr:hypothetical protein Ab1vBOLIVR4_gp66 [Agrobacterium phage OLIVR4]
MTDKITRIGKHGAPYGVDFLTQLRNDLKQLAADVDDTRYATRLLQAASAVNMIRSNNAHS